MTAMSPDHELVGAFVRERSENAFRALVARHVNLVYATALRQVGDSGMAEEIAQNVFVILARKAPRLGGIETLAGWLHRTTILEAKARVRAELRRRRREDAAAEISHLETHGDSPVDALLPLLDEALLHLREGERLALMLRFMEGRSLREVGAALGVEEDAARKRVARALERVTQFFRQRGFSVGAVGGASTLLGQAAQAAPIGLASSAAQAGVTAAGKGSLSIFLFKLMSLTKTQTAAACLVVAAMPLAWQWQAVSKASRLHAGLATQLAAADKSATDLEQELQRTRDALARAQQISINAESSRDVLNAQRAGRLPRPAYQWNDNSPYVRVPKQLLKSIGISSVANRRGELSEQIKEALQITDAEAERLQAAINRFIAGVHDAQAAGVQSVSPTAQDLNGRTEEETRVIEFPDVTAQLKPLREQLFTELSATLGAERFELFREDLREWMPLDDREYGLNSGLAVIPFAHRERFNPATPGFPWLGWQMSKPNGEGMGGSYDIADIPAFLRPRLQDWIDRAQSQPPLK